MAHSTGRKKPVPRSQRKIVSRAIQRKRDDTVQDVSVSLMDMDSAIMYYFENVIKPTVVENGETCLMGYGMEWKFDTDLLLDIVNESFSEGNESTQ